MKHALDNRDIIIEKNLTDDISISMKIKLTEQIILDWINKSSDVMALCHIANTAVNRAKTIAPDKH